MIANVDPNKKAGAVIGSFERGEQFKKIVQRIFLAGDDATRAFRARKFCQHLCHVIGYCAVLNVRAAKDVPNQNVKIKAAGNAQATATFEQRVEKGFVVENQITGFLVGEELDETFGSADLPAEDR